MPGHLSYSHHNAAYDCICARQVSEEAGGARILVALEGKDMGQLSAAAAALRQALPTDAVVAEELDPPGLKHQLHRTIDNAHVSLDNAVQCS